MTCLLHGHPSALNQVWWWRPPLLMCDSDLHCPLNFHCCSDFEPNWYNFYSSLLIWEYNMDKLICMLCSWIYVRNYCVALTHKLSRGCKFREHIALGWIPNWQQLDQGFAVVIFVIQIYLGFWDPDYLFACMTTAQGAILFKSRANILFVCDLILSVQRKAWAWTILNWLDPK